MTHAYRVLIAVLAALPVLWLFAATMWRADLREIEREAQRR